MNNMMIGSAARRWTGQMSSRCERLTSLHRQQYTHGIAPLCLNYRSHATSSRNDSSSYVPRRAVMYVPGNERKKIVKAASLGCDSLCLDCEDGVALNKKEEARATIAEALDDVEFGLTDCGVRCNAIGSGVEEIDLKTMLSRNKLPQTLFIPKVESVEQVEWLDNVLRDILKDRPQQSQLKLILSCETAVGILALRRVCERATELSSEPGSRQRPAGLLFGSDDFCADIGAERTEDSREILYARQKVLLTAKAFRLQAIDMVDINIKDTEGLRLKSEEGARMGFTGKQVIHPNQVPIVQTAFTPKPEKISWATELIAAFDEHQKSGKGAFSFHGKMIDMPLLLQAKNITEMSEAISKSRPH